MRVNGHAEALSVKGGLESSGGDWYEVRVGTVAKFAVRATCPDSAKLKTKLWSDENPNAVSVHPGDLLPFGTEATLLPQESARQYEAGDELFGSVRLTEERQDLSIPEPQERPVVSSNQGILFAMNRWGKITYR